MLAGGVLPWHAGSPGPLRKAKHTTYEGGVRVPCIIRWPGTVQPGRTTAEMASTLDVFMTLAKVSGGKLPDYQLDGFDLQPFLAGKAEESPRSTFLYFGHKGLEAIRSGEWKLRTRDGVELFHMEVDPFERFNRAEEEPEIVDRLNQEMERVRAQLPPRGG
jgi:arylsulfatase A-like enzyme